MSDTIDAKDAALTKAIAAIEEGGRYVVMPDGSVQRDPAWVAERERARAGEDKRLGEGEEAKGAPGEVVGATNGCPPAPPEDGGAARPNQGE